LRTSRSWRTLSIAAVGPIYLAYLRDPDGNRLCAVHRLPA
jgi:hypothetical protein